MRVRPQGDLADSAHWFRLCFGLAVAVVAATCFGPAVARAAAPPVSLLAAPRSGVPREHAKVRFQILYSFAGGADGAHPAAALTMLAHGVLAGTTETGGAKNYGTVFALTPGASGYTESVLHAFRGGKHDGAFPEAALLADSSGTLYGSAPAAGHDDRQAGCATAQFVGCGVIFQLVPGSNGYTESILYAFPSAVDGLEPLGGLIADQSGALYGTTVAGGGKKTGNVFKLTAAQHGEQELPIFTFPIANGPPYFPDGINPSATLVADASGNLYGTTYSGGSCSLRADGCGVVYELSPSGSTYTLNVLHQFQSGSDGAVPLSNLILDGAGALYGTTEFGGTFDDGTVFKLTPTGSGYTESVLYAFAGGTDGALPTAGLVADPSGALFGTTSSGGAAGAGTIFELAPAGSAYTEAVLYVFPGGAGGTEPTAGLVGDRKGNLYGTTLIGGTSDAGTAFVLKR
jgi:uncharacterized repeat protein (TIGR03803 family)